MALDEWKKNSLAWHAEAYPDVWMNVWSGPDEMNSVLMKDPGSTRPFTVNFPVLNMWAHQVPLYSIASVVGTTFTEQGVEFHPGNLTDADHVRVATPLVGFVVSEGCCSLTGWYAPAGAGAYVITLHLLRSEAACCKTRGFTAGGQPAPITDMGGGALRFGIDARGGGQAAEWRS
eukprot:gene1501-9918_t